MNKRDKKLAIVLFYFEYAIIVYNYCITRKFQKKISKIVHLFFNYYKMK